jgi:cell division protein FtsW (lipid II flippase)
MKEQIRKIWKQALAEAGLIFAICVGVVLFDPRALASPIRLAVMIIVLVAVPAVNAWRRWRHLRRAEQADAPNERPA